MWKKLGAQFFKLYYQSVGLAQVPHALGFSFSFELSVLSDVCLGAHHHEENDHVRTCLVTHTSSSLNIFYKWVDLL